MNDDDVDDKITTSMTTVYMYDIDRDAKATTKITLPVDASATLGWTDRFINLGRPEKSRRIARGRCSFI